MASQISFTETTIDPSSSDDAIGHISGRTPLPPIPSINVGVLSTSTAPPASREAASGAAVSTSAANT